LQVLLNELNLTGPGPNDLKLGTCEAKLDNFSQLQSGDWCHLTCLGKASAQRNQDFFHAISTEIDCQDGTIVQYPPKGTWCSEASWEVPPLIFLGTISLAAALAGCMLDYRQHDFEQRCMSAMTVYTKD